MSIPEQAIARKNQGNEAFKNHDWIAAIERYSEAIELDGQQAIFFCNRAQAHIKTESYGLAISDASQAINLDPDNVKGYYRRALAYTAILRSKDALRDFKTVVRKRPSDAEAKLRLRECEKVVKRIEFLKAIEIGEPPSASEGLELESMTVEDEYDGKRLEAVMTQEFVDDMIERFKNGKKIHKKYVYQIILAAQKLVYDEPTMVEVKVEKGNRLTVCGDTHGMYLFLQVALQIC